MNGPEERVRLGRTGVSVSRLGFGTTALAGMFQPVPSEDAIGAVKAARAHGLIHFDTAPQYGGGVAERRLGEALRDLDREACVISTKVGKLIRPEGVGAPVMSAFVGAPAHSIVYDYSYDGALRSLEESLERLGLDQVDILLIHDVNRKFHGDAVMERCDEALAGACRALRRLRDEGVIRAYGSATQDVDVQLRFVREADPDCIMLPSRYTLLDRSAERELLSACLARGVGVVVAAPFDSGILATGARSGATYAYQPAEPDTLAQVAALERACDGFSTPLAAAALQFPLRHPAVTSVVVGMRSADEVERNAAALRRKVPAALWELLEV